MGEGKRIIIGNENRFTIVPSPPPPPRNNIYLFYDRVIVIMRKTRAFWSARRSRRKRGDSSFRRSCKSVVEPDVRDPPHPPRAFSRREINDDDRSSLGSVIVIENPRRGAGGFSPLLEFSEHAEAELGLFMPGKIFKITPS